MLFLIKNLDRDFIEPIGIVPEEGELARELRAAQCKTFVTSLVKLKPRNWREFRTVYRGIRRIVISEKPDIMHADYDADLFFSAMAKRAYPTKAVWHLRWTMPAVRDRLLENLADGIIGVSDGAGRRLSKSIFQSDKYETIYNGVYTDEFKPATDKSALRERLNLPRERKIFIFAGVLKDGKGVLDIVDALGILKDGFKLMPYTIFLGNKGNDSVFRKFESKVSQYSLIDDIALLGQKSNIEEWMSASDILLIPSHEGNEGMPRVAVEAMSCGTPVIGTDISGTNEAITDETGILVPEKSPWLLAEAMKSLLNDDKQRQEMSIAARRRAVEVFDIKAHADKVQQFYKRILRI